uniref:phosphoacetylglucosamine mutase n=1 Tax=Albugo laibachii Nc14 TaxID=890382 RepID=F0WKE2_9STRA|nr:phosphoacetylglucosamine mutase putative [Albugo laibachii Nc14]|eukprot:CCA21746.1 phosphoacetylglucosamine mutase putative [Albugo laibachii Nc14]
MQPTVMDSGSARFKYREVLPSARASDAAQSAEIVATPSRDVIYHCIREYTRQKTCEESKLTILCERLERELEPYQVLKLGGYSLGNSSTKILSSILFKNQTLRTLDLGFNRINDKGANLLAKALEKNTSLERIYLSGNEIGLAGADAFSKALCTNSTLKTLHLSGNNIGEAGAQALAKGLRTNRCLRNLYIGTNGIGSTGMLDIVRALENNTVLQELTLSQNRIGNEGVRHLAEAFKRGKLHITTLEIGKNDIGSRGAELLADALQQVQIDAEGDSEGSTSEVLVGEQDDAREGNASEVSISNSCQEKSMEARTNRNQLQNLYIDNNPIGDAGAQAFGKMLGKNHTLRVLDLSYTQMSLLGLRELCIGIRTSRSLLCLLLDGHDWSSTKYMKKAHPLLQQSILLSVHSANQFAVKCVLGAVQSNANSVLYKLTGVDLSLVKSLDRSEGSRRLVMARPMDTCMRNEVVLRHSQAQRFGYQTAVLHKRKGSREEESGVPQMYGPPSQKQKVADHHSQDQTTSDEPLKIDTRVIVATTDEIPVSVGARNGTDSFQLSGSSEPKILAVKSPRFEVIMQDQAKKIVQAIDKLPFSPEEDKTLSDFYVSNVSSSFKRDDVQAKSEKRQSDSSEPASDCSRLARYPKTKALWLQWTQEDENHSSSSLENQKSRKVLCLNILRQLHYLVGAFRQVPNPDRSLSKYEMSSSMSGGNSNANVAALSAAQPSSTGSTSANASTKSGSVAERSPRLVEEINKFGKPSAIEKELRYGTSGFRCDASLLDAAVHRMGMLAILRSKKEEKITGLMITASHNPANDNGIKLIDPHGDLMTSSWEDYANRLANAAIDKVLEILDHIVVAEKIDLDTTGNVFIAKDTRPSSEHLAEVAREGALAIGGNVLDFGLQTAPQLHHLVRMWNFEQYNKGDWASEIGYYNMLVDGFKQLTGSQDSKKLEMRTPLYVDCAHGIGATQLTKLAKELGECLHLEVCNLPNDGELNHECGADYVQKARKHPAGFSRDNFKGKRCCSLDGDADRVVFHYFDENADWHLLNGDKIACLFAEFFLEKLQVLDLDKSVRLGCVQTAYANGASTRYLREKGINVVVSETGVKFCHAKALEFDIGITFESNGHGTVLIKDELVDKLQKWESSTHEDRKKQAIIQLLASHQLLNQATGDAISDLLFVEVLLIQKQWSIADWDAIYSDKPSRDTKVPVGEMKSTSEWSSDVFQQKVDEIISEMAISNVRAFVRASGTESVVRVYAEADTQQECDALALKLAQWVHSHCNGVGASPTAFVA